VCECGAYLPVTGRPLAEIAQSRKRYHKGFTLQLNDDLLDKICELVREGVSPHIAAQRSGVNRATFMRWWKSPGEEFDELRNAVGMARAHARSEAEMAVHKGIKDRRWWLRSQARDDEGPFPGWREERTVKGEVKHAHMHLMQTLDVSKLTLEELEVLDDLADRAMIEVPAKELDDGSADGSE